jgi:acetyl esterase/lipase
MRPSRPRHATALLAAVALSAACSVPGAPISQESDAVTTTRLSYGDAPDQWVDLSWPNPTDRVRGMLPVVVFVHGGFWQQAYGADLMAPLVADAVARGYVAANVEYRRVGGGGGWPQTFADVAAAIDVLAASSGPLDLDRVVVVGHSAGGHLAVWAASRPGIPPGEVGAAPTVVACAAVSQAGVVALERAAREGVGGTAVESLMGGGPGEVPERYMVGDPVALAPPPVPVLLVHAPEDTLVPFSQSEAYVEVAGERAELSPVPGDHFTVIDPGDPSWATTMDWVARTC